MPYILNHLSSANAPSFCQLYRPIQKAMIAMPPLEARGHRPLKMTFEDQLKSLIFFHLEEHTSAQHRKVVKARSLLCYWVVKELGVVMSTLGRRLNISTAAVSQSVLRGEKLAKCHQYKLMNNFVK